MPRVICIGEAIIDFISQREGRLVDSPGFEKVLGGAPANVAVGLAKLGVKSGFIGKVGDDAFGHFIVKTLKKNNVDIKQLKFSNDSKTGIAFISLDKHGNRDFTFYRDECADLMLEEKDIDSDYIAHAKIFHFGTISLSKEPVRSATKFALSIAEKSSVWISFDPNIRLHLWRNESQVKKVVIDVIPHCDIIKISIEELQSLFPNKGIENASDKILEMGTKLVVVSLGANGCFFNDGSHKDYVKGFKVKAIDTTGAGDAFVAGMLKGILDRGGLELEKDELIEIMRFANAVAGMTTTKKGAITGFPTLKEVERFFSNATS